jgi:uncharacterized protein YrzB (UPF0473 family)
MTQKPETHDHDHEHEHEDGEEVEIFVLVDEETGEELEVMELAQITVDDKVYSICAPFEQMEQEDGDLEIIPLAIVDGERVAIEDEAEANMIFEMAQEMLLNDEE